MIPDGIATLYAFLGLIAPGLLYQLQRERARPTLEETAFREASRVAFTSLIFTTLSITLLIGASRLAPQLFVDLAAWIDKGNSYLESHLWLVATSIMVEVALACAIAGLAAYTIDKIKPRTGSSIVKTSVWYQLFQGDLPKDKVAWALAELSDGTLIWGFVDFYTAGQSTDERDISFKGPGLTVQRKASEKEEQDYWKYVVVKSSDILMIKIRPEPKKKS